jgi:hypothetical protein
LGYFKLNLGMAALYALTLLPPCAAAAERPAVSVIHSTFHGWKSIVIRNGAAEVVIVPDIGRVMQFNLVDNAGPFWLNPAFDKDMPADGEGWKNFGGDKAWPAPQVDWPKVAGRGWPPPTGFDAAPFTASIKTTAEGSQVQLVSPVDPTYGVRIRRTISLNRRKPVLTIETAYKKVRGAPVRIGIWTITQLTAPDRAFILLPPRSRFLCGYTNLPPAPPDLKIEGRLLSLSRDPANKVKIGSDGESLLWVGSGADLLLERKADNSDAKKREGSQLDWPELGSHSQIYTNPGNEIKYVEFELLDRLHDLKRGQNTSLEVRYTLIPRTESDPAAEARKVFHGQ